jgi:antitoxin CcdA
MRMINAHSDAHSIGQKEPPMREDGKPYRAGLRQRGPQQQKQPKKKAVNLSIDAELLAEAKAAGTNLSGVLETALKEQLREQRWQKWREDNRAAIEKSNAQLERDGPWYQPEWLRK